MATEPWTPRMPPAEATPAGEPPMLVGEDGEGVEGRSPWYLAYLRLRRNKLALAFGALFVLIVLFCLAAPLWSKYVADTGPNDTHLGETDTIEINGNPTDIVGKCNGPTVGEGGELSIGGNCGVRVGPGREGRVLGGGGRDGGEWGVRT